jgi:hypothetical protein
LKIPVILDRRALEMAGIKPDAPVTLRAADISAEAALNLLLGPLKLSCTLRDEALVVTTVEEAQVASLTRVYDVAGLVSGPDEQLGYDELVKMITTTVRPDSWEVLGGAGTIAPYQAPGISALSIRQTWTGHREVERLLMKLRDSRRTDLPPLGARRVGPAP